MKKVKNVRQTGLSEITAKIVLNDLVKDITTQEVEQVKHITVYGTLSSERYDTVANCYITSYNNEDVKVKDKVLTFDLLYEFKLDIPEHLIKIFNSIKYNHFTEIRISFTSNIMNLVHSITKEFISGVITFNNNNYHITLRNKNKKDNVITEDDLYNLRQALESISKSGLYTEYKIIDSTEGNYRKQYLVGTDTSISTTKIAYTKGVFNIDTDSWIIVDRKDLAIGNIITLMTSDGEYTALVLEVDNNKIKVKDLSNSKQGLESFRYEMFDFQNSIPLVNKSYSDAVIYGTNSEFDTDESLLNLFRQTDVQFQDSKYSDYPILQTKIKKAFCDVLGIKHTSEGINLGELDTNVKDKFLLFVNKLKEIFNE